MSPPKLSVIIPLYNEEENVPLLQEQLANALGGLDYEIVLVDDGSTDGTAAKVQRNGRTRLLCFEKNAGQSAAMFAGIMAANGKYIACLDGDLQNDPADIPPMLAKLEADPALDLVCGYRVNRKDTWSKRMTSRVANFVRSRFIGDGVHDTGCTLKVMRTDCRRSLVPFYGMHRFIPALIKGAGYRLVEVPVNHRPRQHGASKYGFGNRAFKATRDMFGVRWLLTRQLDYRIKPESSAK